MNPPRCTFIGIVFLALVAAASPRAAADSAVPANADITAQIIARYWAFIAASTKRDAVAVTAMYDNDAIVLPPSEPPIVGKKNIEDFWSKRFIKAASKKSSYQSITPVSIELVGDYAIDVETFAGTVEDSAAQTKRPFASKNLVVWHKEADGTWYLLRDMWSGDTAPAPTTKS